MKDFFGGKWNMTPLPEFLDRLGKPLEYVCIGFARWARLDRILPDGP